jgi:NAD(P)-dependent dehydrogenase (short-subunit alcohol dehydrogenase family)
MARSPNSRTDQDARARVCEKGRHREQFANTIPVGRFGRPEEIARAFRFLVDEDAGYITGSVVAVNGGFDM